MIGFIEGTVETIDPRKRSVSFVDENQNRRTLFYRHCILAPGSVTEFFARRNLESRGIEVWLKARVARYENNILQIEDGRELNTETIIWNAGSQPSPLVAQIRLDSDKDRRLPTGTDLQAMGYSNLWAVGDSARIPDGDGQRYQPPTAQHAVRQGRHAARNVIAALEGRPARPFGYKSIGMLATLGRHRGIGRIWRFKLSGFAAWFIWRSYYLFVLPRWDRRLRVAIDWFLDFFFPPDIVETKVEPLHGVELSREAEKPAREPEPVG